MTLTSRNLIIDSLSDPRLRPRETDEVALYVIVGFGAMGQNLAHELALHAHFENERRARLVILTENPEADADSFLARFGQFSPKQVVPAWSQIEYPKSRDEWKHCEDARPEKSFQIDDPRAIEYTCNAVFAPLPNHFSDRPLSSTLKQLAGEAGVKPAIIFCMQNDQDNYVAATVLNRELRTMLQTEIPSFVWLPGQKPLQEMLRRQNGLDPTGKRFPAPPDSNGSVPPFTPFGSFAESITLSELASPFIDVIAKIIFADYKKLDYEADERTVNRQWDEDLEVYRQSNRAAAVHALIKLKVIGIPINHAGLVEHTSLESFPELTEADLKKLSRVEHNRWVAERLLQGFQWAESDSNAPPRRHQICPWDNLSDAEKDKDFNQVLAVYEFLKKKWQEQK